MDVQILTSFLYATFHDFTTNFTHKLLHEKSHVGFYLFWLTWIGSSIYFLVKPEIKKVDELVSVTDLEFENGRE